LFASIINNLAHKDICWASEIEAMTAVDREKEIQRIVDWARKNAKKNEGTLLLEGLEEEWKPGKVHWYWLKTRLSRLVDLKEKGALPLLHSRLDDQKTTSDEVCWILSFGRRLDANSFKKKAEQLLHHESLPVQQQAALLLHAMGERKHSHDALARVLEKGTIGFAGELQTPEVLDVLVKEGTPAAYKVIAGITANPHMLNLGWERARLLRIIAAANLPDAYRYYLPLLDIRGNEIGSSRYANGTVVGEIIANEIIEQFAPNDPDVIRIKKMFPKAADQIAPLKEWLRANAKSLSTPKDIE
jgi:hypothetical protein